MFCILSSVIRLIVSGSLIRVVCGWCSSSFNGRKIIVSIRVRLLKLCIVGKMLNRYMLVIRLVMIVYSRKDSMFGVGLFCVVKKVVVIVVIIVLLLLFF